MAEQSNSKRLAKNTLFMYFRMGFLMLISLYSSRVILQQLGVDDYGIYNLVGSIVMMFSALKEMFANSTSRFMAFELGQKNEEKLNLIYNLSTYINGMISIIFLVLVEIIGLWFLEYKINVAPDRLFAAHMVFQFSVISTIATIMTTPFNAMIIAHERMDFYAYLSIFEGLARLGVCFLLPLFGFDKLIFFGFLYLCIAIIILLINRIFCSKNFKECKFKLVWDKEYFRKMMSFAGWTFFGNCSYTLAQNGINMIFNVFGGPIVNAARGVSYQVNNAVNQFVNSIAVVTTPFSVKSYASKEYDRFFSLFFITSKLYFLIELLFTVILAFNAKEILHLWLGQIPEYTIEFVILVLLQSVFRSLCNPLGILFFSVGKIKQQQISEGIILALPIILSYALLHFGYPFYTAFLSMIGCEIIRILVLSLFAKKVCNLNLKNYAVKVLFPCTICLIAFGISYKAMFDNPSHLGLQVLATVGTCVMLVLLMILFGVSKDERIIIKNLIKHKQ